MKEAQADFVFPYCFQKCQKRVQKRENYMPSWGAPSSALTVFQFLSLILMAFLVVDHIPGFLIQLGKRLVHEAWESGSLSYLFYIYLHLNIWS